MKVISTILDLPDVKPEILNTIPKHINADWVIQLRNGVLSYHYDIHGNCLTDDMVAVSFIGDDIENNIINPL
ncbi:hypothetical protein COB55_05825 [Candidatus Wolfebacteria bacterium]|nr:MAG: hypothetical protein COB55_05825 [Candidatus Wolfebacteria bacterium]